MKRIVVNLIVFDIVWLACVWGAARNLGWLGPVSLLPALAIHFWLAEARAAEARFLAVATVAGLVIESVHGLVGALVFPKSTFGFGPAWLAPLWLVAMWTNFGTLLATTLRWLGKFPVGGVIFGAVVGPLAYVAGNAFGALEVGPQRLLSLAIIGVSYAIATPALLALVPRMIPEEPEAPVSARTPARPASG